MFRRKLYTFLDEYRDYIFSRCEKVFAGRYILTILLTITKKKTRSNVTINSSRNGALQGIYSGRRCVIVGSSPSIHELNLENIKSDFIFLLNKTYLLREHFGIQPKAIVLSDPKAYEDYGEEINFSEYEYVFLSAEIEACSEPANVYRFDYYQFPRIYDGFCETTLTRPLYHGHTVAHYAVQIAIAMGFEELVLIGIDLSFASDKPHFYNSSDREKHWAIHVSQLRKKRMLDAFRYLARYAAENGIRLINASPQPSMEGIYKCKFEEIYPDI